MDIIFLYLGPILYLLSPASPSRLSTDLLADRPRREGVVHAYLGRYRTSSTV